MAIETGIQWCDGTVNPVAGCDGCELFETREQVIARIAKAVVGNLSESSLEAVAANPVGDSAQTLSKEERHD